MGCVYRYTDVEDNIVKYIGIVWSENRTLLQRIKEHQTYDGWCNGKRWKIEYLDVDNKTDCEGLEGHFISLYGTNKWYNKGKANWGISSIYSMVNWVWKEFNYDLENIEIQKRNNRRINDVFLSNLYNKSIYIFNNGACYCFFKTFKKEPVYVYMALSPDEEQFAIENNIRYMNKEQLDCIVKMAKEDNKPFGYGRMLSEIEQIKIESGLKVEQCFTYKEQARMFDEIKHKTKGNIFNIENIKEFVRIRVYEMRAEVEVLQAQKLKVYV